MSTTLHFSPRPNRASEIHWLPWGPDAFKRAQREQKPVLLAISAVWCHWCHVMDETSYSDQDVIGLINEAFVPIRVDNDQRPDINARYNMGGWPTTVLLTPDGEILRGGTYLPPESMRPFLQQVSDLYREPANRLEFATRIAEIKAKRAARRPPAVPGSLDPANPRATAEAISEAFDDEYGGFGTEPKFPQTDALHFLLDAWTRTPDGRGQTIVQMTLRAMAGGGMYDHVEGGFFRYSTTRDFSVPHYEKMLEDLAALLLACARARALFGDEGLGQVAIDVKRYLDASLWSADHHGYGGSQDADEEYYLRNGAGRSALQAPYVDTTIYTAWNAQAAHALIVAGPLLAGAGIDAASWIARGVEILEMLWSAMLVDGMMARYHDGAPHVRGLLADQAWCAWAALAAFSATGQSLWLARASALLEQADALYDDAGHAYVDRATDSDEAGRLSEPAWPLQENALIARALLRRSAFTGAHAPARRARLVLERFASGYQSIGIFAAGYSSALLDALEPPWDVSIVGQASDPATRALRDAMLQRATPALRVNSMEPGEHERLAALDITPAAAPTAYVCRDGVCVTRTDRPDELLRSVSDLR